MIAGLPGEEPESGSARVYGRWPLLRAGMLLPESIRLPEDIPVLVGKAYDEAECRTAAAGDPVLSEAWEVFQREQDRREERARQFRLRWPYPGTGIRTQSLYGWSYASGTTGKGAEDGAGVRDGGSGIEVILLRRTEEGASFFPWREDCQVLSLDRMPDPETARRIWRERIRLPRAMAPEWEIADIVRELEKRDRRASRSPAAM